MGSQRRWGDSSQLELSLWAWFPGDRWWEQHMCRESRTHEVQDRLEERLGHGLIGRPNVCCPELTRNIDCVDWVIGHYEIKIFDTESVSHWNIRRS